MQYFIEKYKSTIFSRDLSKKKEEELKSYASKDLVDVFVSYPAWKEIFFKSYV